MGSWLWKDPEAEGLASVDEHTSSVSCRENTGLKGDGFERKEPALNTQVQNAET